MTATALSIQTLDVNGLRMQVAIQGSGPLVLLLLAAPSCASDITGIALPITGSVGE